MKNRFTSKESNEVVHFDKYASEYDENYGYSDPFTKYKINKKFSNLANFIESNYKKPIRILEIGCGTGEYTKKIAQKFPKSKIVGLDISPGILKLARVKCKNLKNVKFVATSAYKTKFPASTFDVVVGYYVLHHIDIPRFASEAVRILKKGGTMYFVEPNILNPIVYLIKSNKIIKKMVGDSPDEWAINPLTIDKQFRGFKIIDICTTEFLWPVKFLPLKFMIELDKMSSYFKKVFFIKHLGGSVEVSLLKSNH